MKLTNFLLGGLLVAGTYAGSEVAEHHKEHYYGEEPNEVSCSEDCIKTIMVPWVYQAAEDGFRHALRAYNSTEICLASATCQESLTDYIDWVHREVLADSDGYRAFAGMPDLTTGLFDCDADCIVSVLDSSTTQAAAMAMVLGTKHFRGTDMVRDRWITGPPLKLATMISTLTDYDEYYNATDFSLSRHDLDCIDGPCGAPAPITTTLSATPTEDESTLSDRSTHHSKRGQSGFWFQMKNMFRRLAGRQPLTTPPTSLQLTESNKAQYDQAMRLIEDGTTNKLKGGAGSWLRFLKKTRVPDTTAPVATPWDTWVADNGLTQRTFTASEVSAGVQTFGSDNMYSYVGAKDKYNSVWQWVANQQAEPSVPSAGDPDRQPWQGLATAQIPGEQPGVPNEPIQGWQMEFTFADHDFSDFSGRAMVDEDGDYRIFPREEFDPVSGDPVAPDRIYPVLARGADGTEYIAAREVDLHGRFKQRYLRQIGKRDDATLFAVLNWDKIAIKDRAGNKKEVWLGDKTVKPAMDYGELKYHQYFPQVEGVAPQVTPTATAQRTASATRESEATLTPTQPTFDNTDDEQASPTDTPEIPDAAPPTVPSVVPPPAVGGGLPGFLPIFGGDDDDDDDQASANPPASQTSAAAAYPYAAASSSSSAVATESVAAAYPSSVATPVVASPPAQPLSETIVVVPATTYTLGVTPLVGDGYASQTLAASRAGPSTFATAYYRQATGERGEGGGSWAMATAGAMAGAGGY